MCGICGIAVSSRSPRRLESDLIVRMRDTLHHRGPDDKGIFLADGIGLGHRRLSIVDVDGGHQPFVSDDGRFQLVYNGEIYNHPSLMADLEALGIRYSTHCDTETVLRLYQREGGGFVKKLRGMFALAIWDSTRKELFLARDRFGIKPLYFVHTPDGSLYFASEIKALLQTDSIKASMNLDALPDYLANHAPSGDTTLFAGVKRLLPGQSLLWTDGRLTITDYLDSSNEVICALELSDRDLVEEYDERFQDAVRSHLMADVPLGVFLSGGLDSAAITATMSRLGVENIKTFSVGFAEREANELAYARLVADKFRTDHHEVLVDSAEFWNAVPQLIWHEDEPMAHPSSVPLNILAQLAAKQVKVVLTGEGSDETLAGYNRYRVTLMNMDLGRKYQRSVPRQLQSVIQNCIRYLPKNWKARHRLERTFLNLPADLENLYFDNFAVFSRQTQEKLLHTRIKNAIGHIDPYSVAKRAIAEINHAPLLDQLLFADTKTYLHELLMKQDQMSMAASLESRVPFLDNQLVDFAQRLPQRLRLNGLTTKVVLRYAMKDVLPPPILSRRKMGFPVPIGPWLRGAHKSLLSEYVVGERASARRLFDPVEVKGIVDAHLAGIPGHEEKLWSLMNLEIWQRIFLDGEAIEDIAMSNSTS